MNGQILQNPLLKGIANQVFEQCSNSEVLTIAMRYFGIKHPTNKPLTFKTVSGTGVVSKGIVDSLFTDLFDERECIIYYGAGSFIPAPAGYKTLDKPPYPVSQFLSKTATTQVYVNEEKQRAVILIKTSIGKEWAMDFVASLFRILPWRFEDSQNSSNIEFFSAFAKRDIEKINKMCNDAINSSDLRSLYLKNIFSGYSDSARVKRLQRLERQIKECHEYIDEYFQYICNQQNSLDALNSEYMMLNSADKKSDDEIIDFFNMHKQIQEFEMSSESNNEGKSVVFNIRETITFYDEDLYDRVSQAGFYKGADVVKPYRALLDAIFKDRKGSIIVESVFKLRGYASLNAMASTYLEGDVIHHPHIYYHACLGGNKEPIIRAMNDGNWKLAISQAIAATKNINWGDSVVVPKFISDIISAYNSDIKTILADNGVEMTLKEFEEYIKGEQNG